MMRYKQMYVCEKIYGVKRNDYMRTIPTFLFELHKITHRNILLQFTVTVRNNFI